MDQPGPGAQPAPAQLSPDGQWWWDGAQWRPVPQQAPMGYVGTPTPVRSTQVYAPAPARGRSPGAIVAIVLACVIGIPTVLGILAAVAIPVFLNQRDQEAQVAAETTVRGAMLAQETFAVENGYYTPHAQDLFGYGFVAEPGTTLDVTATDVGYCVASGAVGGPVTAWATEAGPTDVPCL